MRALGWKLARDVWHSRGPLGAITVVMASGVALFVTLRSMHGYLRDRQASYYAESRFAELFVHLGRAPGPAAARLRAIPGVREAEPRIVAGAVLRVPGLAEPAAGWLVSIPLHERPTLNAVVLRRGRYPAADRPGEVLVSEAFARANGLAPGDTLGAVLRGRWETLRIAGTAISPEFIYEIPPGGGSPFPDNRRFGVIWMPEPGLAAAFDLTGAFNDVSFTLLPGAVAAGVMVRVDRVLAPYGGQGAYARADQISHQFVSSEITETDVTGLLLPAIFLGVTAFLLHLVMSRLVATEREPIAVLKAFGYRGGRIALHYLAFAMVPVVAGTLVGGGAGLWLAGALARVYARFFQFPDVAFRPDLMVLVIAVLVSGGAALVGAFGAVRRVLALPPAEAMRPESPASYHAGLLDRIGLAGRVPLAARTIVRNLERRPAQALLATVGLALAVSLTVAGRFMFDSIEVLQRLQFHEAWRQDAALGFDRPLAPAVRHELARLPGVRLVELRRDVAARLRYGARSERVALQGLEPAGRLRRVVDAEGRVFPPPAAGLLLGGALARRLGVVPGDSVVVEMLQGRRAVAVIPVAGTAEELMGLSAYLRLDRLQRLLGEAPAVTGALLAVDAEQRPALTRRLREVPRVSGVSWLDQERAGFERTIAESFRISITTMVLFAVVIAGGVVYNASRVALAERGRELASLRVLGFTIREVAAMLLGEQAALTLLAIPLGLGLGRLLCWLVVTRFTSDLFRIPFAISDWTYLFAVLVLVLAAAGSALVIRRRLARLDLVAVLKTRE